MQAYLIVEAGQALPRICELDPALGALLGRSRDSTLILQDPHASRKHARMVCQGDSWIIRDLETTNGTRVDGTRIQDETPLTEGQTIAIGEVRLRFSSSSAIPPREIATTLDASHLAARPATDLERSDVTPFHVDELTALFRFMNDSLAQTTPHHLVSLALKASLEQTGADMAGFLGLDPENPELRLIEPADASVDQHLSHQLTQAVLRAGRSVWLCSPQGGTVESESLLNFHDAVCVPLRASQASSDGGVEAPLGALHVYKTSRPFSERQVRFLEVLCSSLAGMLYLLRSRRALEADNSRLRIQVPAASDELVGSSSRMRQMRQQVAQVADAPCTVLIHGASGVGKELVALALHRQSSRHRGPMVMVNCAAIAAGLAESELFGHVRGAFSGSAGAHPGYFAQADMGTLFLDELGELPLELQAKVLRAIENRTFRPVGATREERADVRIIAATNRDLKREVREGRFRRDLYFRMTIMEIIVPPLCEHLEDVPELAQHFLERLNQTYRKCVTISDGALNRLQTYDWPGNVRQLRTVLEGAVAMAPKSGVLHASDLRMLNEELNLEPQELPPSLNLEELEAWAIRHAVRRTKTNTAAAQILGLHRGTLIEKMKRYGIGREGGGEK